MKGKAQNKSNKMEVFIDILSTLLDIITISKLLDYLILEWYGKEINLKNLCIKYFIKNINLKNLYNYTTLGSELIEEILLKKIAEIYNSICLFEFRKNMYSNKIDKCVNNDNKIKLTNNNIDISIIDINNIIMELNLIPCNNLKNLLLNKFNNIKYLVY